MANALKNPLIGFLSTDIKASGLKGESLKKADSKLKSLLETQEDWDTIKSQLKTEDGFTPEVVNTLSFTHNLASWAKNSESLVSFFQKEKTTNSMRDIALRFNKNALSELVKKEVTVPVEVETERFQANLANELHDTLFHQEPSAVLANMIKDADVPMLNDAIGGGVAAILERQIDFNIKTTSVYEIFKQESVFENVSNEVKEGVKTQLKTLQRIVAISPSPEVVPVLFNANLHNAFQITEMPIGQFKAFLKSSNLDEGTITQLHSNAQQARVRNEQALIALKEVGEGTGIAFIDKSLRVGEALPTEMDGIETATLSSSEVVRNGLEKHNLSWDLLFGDADFCECGECTSVYSAAAYFVELMQYLRNNNIDPQATGTLAIKPDPKNILGTPLQKLLDRRPDLGCLELTCKNTNTILPYVDLVNEVMENYVVFKHTKPFNVADETSGELLGQPQHTEYQAYCILKDEVYPFTLPYHQPIDAARIYLDYLGTSRFEVIDTFRKNNKGVDEVLTKLQDERLDRAADAEFLGLTKEEYVILTKESFGSKAYYDKIHNKVFTDKEYQEKICLKEVWEYYGYDKKDDLVLLSQIKKEFLRRTGIDYINLVDLLKTEYINPCMPKGKSKAIMESLRFSYRFLQNYAAANGIDKLAEVLSNTEALLDLLPQLKGTTTFFTSAADKSKMLCQANVEEDEITSKDILHWVKCHFERVGKMIVIESGKTCFNGKIKTKDKDVYYETGYFVENCNIYFQKERIKILQGTIDKNSGEIKLEKGTNLIIGENYSFFSANGIVGKFVIKENKSYLLIQELDSCDLDTATLKHLDGSDLNEEEYDRIHRFIRLWRKMGWTIDETDKAIIGLSKNNSLININIEDSIEDDSCCEDCMDADCTDDCGDCADCKQHSYDINPILIHQLVAVKQLLEKTGLELIKLLSFWTNISNKGEKSLYNRLFLTHNVLAIDKIFKADSTGNFLTSEAKITEHLPVIMASLNLSSDDIEAIMTATTMEDKLTLNNLSMLYRYRLLSKALGLKVSALISVMPMFGNVFESADATLEFIRNWEKMEDAGFTYQQLNYIIKNIDNTQKPFTPSQKTVLQVTKTLYDGLNLIEETHKDLIADKEAITELDKQKSIQNQATTEYVRAKASLIFDGIVVEKIIDFLEATNTFTTNAPKSIILNLSQDNTLSKKLKYDKINGSIQIKGILTEAERINFVAINNDSAWVAALTRIEKQQSKLFKELLAGIFESEKAKSPEWKLEVESAEKIIKNGDINIALEELNGAEDTNTAPQKRVAFLTIFLPYLRQELTHRFVVETLSNAVGLNRQTTDVLVTELLTIGTPKESVYNVFEKIKESAKPIENNWEGFLIPSSDGVYTFIVKDSDLQPILSLGGVLLSFTAEEDPTNEWWSTTIKLQAGKLYKLRTIGVELKSILWKTNASAIAAIPSSLLIPDFASKQCEPALIALKKAAILVSTFDLSVDEIKYLANHAIDFENIDFNAISLAQFFRLEAYTRLRNTLPKGKINLLEFWAWTNDVNSDVSKLSEKISALTTWNIGRIVKLTAANHFNLSHLEYFKNEENLLKLQKSLEVVDKIGMDVDLLFDWAKPTSNFKKCRNIADSIEKAIRSQYKQTDWEQVVKPLSDKLRNNQKNALIAYLLQRKELIDWGVTDADGLFEYFLIDVQMDACMETSRIKQAISSVQLFVMRCQLGLEEEHNGITPNVLDRERWEWMQRYRVWEANRKVFLYPENWIESNLRDDKSPFFKELESELLQKDINKENVTDALKAYLYKVDEVANMEVVGLYIDGTRTGITWTKGAKLHIFARTRNAPYFFFYRYLALDEMNWYAWEKMQVDIPSYDVEDSDGVIKDNGCYLTPVVWNGRLLIFFPQFMKKTRPNPNNRATSIKDLANNSPESNRPIEYWEIKMAWSEYRNGKWTQKQLSKDVLVQFELDISKYKFIPAVHPEAIYINVDDNTDDDDRFSATFIFEGSKLSKMFSNKTVNGVRPIFTITAFHKSGTDLPSLQFDQSDNRVNSSLTFNDLGNKSTISNLPNYSATSFYQPYTNDLLGKINTGQLEAFFRFNTEGIVSATDKAEAYGLFDPDNNSATSNNIYHELKRPYSLYNWELFFHTPMMLADALSKAQQFEEAMKWYHFVFSPLANGTKDNRFWQFLPFQETNSQKILDNIFNNLKPNKSDDAINEWRNHPFMPHLVARSRPVAYMKWVVMKYIDNLLAWGDYLFRQDTIESINQATQLYILASHILGARPMMIPKRGKIKPQTYLSLLDKWDAFGNTMVELEIAMPFSNQITQPTGVVSGEVGFANIFGFSSALYFCIPNNPKLMGYWDTIADRLFKIRHCQNIEGIFRKLPLFEPPIDPALLVKAAAQGLSIASVLNDLNTPMPNYRFYYLLQKALELCGELKSLGGALLSAIEKKDNEVIALMRAKHESVMHNLVMEVKKLQLEEAQKSLETLQQNRIAPAERMKYYLKLSGIDESSVPSENAAFSGLANEIVTVVGDSGLKLIPFEKEDMDKAHEASDWQIGIGVVETLSSIFHVIPSTTVDAKPLGVGAGIVWGFPNLANALSAVGRGLRIKADHLSYQSSNAGKKGGFTRAIQERIQQANAAGYEIKQIDIQITAQQIRIQMANLEIANQQKQIDNANEVEEFLKNKYTNEELYTWMRGSLKTLYHQVYSLAYDLAKKAEKTYRFERGLSSSNFIQSGYWDAGRDGLLAGEQLYVGLKQLEAAYQENRGYDYEITKHVSLRQINPLAILQLRETGKCEFIIPEVLFDMDYPGHYKRRIKSVSISIPCIAGPYTGINATLRLLENKFRNTAIGGKNYSENSEESDERFSSFIIPINAIAASSAQNESGMFELNFKDERYLPFEGAGVISKWRLELPVFKQFDYNTISDAIIHVRYTAAEGGERLKKAAYDTTMDFMESVEELGQQEGLFTIIDLQHDLPTEWHKALTIKTVDNKYVMDLSKVEQFIPFYATANKKTLKATDIIMATDIKEDGFLLLEETFTKGIKVNELETNVLSGQELDIKDWKLTLPDSVKKENKVWMIVRFILK